MDIIDYRKGVSLQRRIELLKAYKERVENKDGFFDVKFGISIGKHQEHYMPIEGEEHLVAELTAVVKKYCDAMIPELEEVFKKI